MTSTNSPGKLAIVGASGFLGWSLSEAAESRGIEVFGFSRGYEPPTGWEMGQPFPWAEVPGGTPLIFTAHDMLRDDAEFHASVVDSILKDRANFPQHRDSRFIYISSISADPSIDTEYAKTKRACEAVVRAHRQSIVRPGLIVGGGGSFGRLLTTLRQLPVVPVPGHLDRKVYWVGITECVEALLACALDANPRSELNLFRPEPILMGDLIETALRTLGVRRVFFSVGVEPAASIVQALSSLGIQLPVTSSTLRASARTASCGYQSDLPMSPNPMADFRAAAGLAIRALGHAERS